MLSSVPELKICLNFLTKHRKDVELGAKIKNSFELLTKHRKDGELGAEIQNSFELFNIISLERC